MRICFKTGFMLFLVIILVVPVFGQNCDDMKTIHIVTPEWEDQTEKDGTGLFFDMIRSVYEPVGVKMMYEIIPWKRAVKMIQEKNADAMLSVVPQEYWLIPKYPVFVEHVAAVFKKDKIKDWKGKESLEGKDVLWIRGYAFNENENMKNIKLKRFQEIDEHYQAWIMLEIDRTDVYIDALIDIDLYIRKNKVDMTPWRLEILWSRNNYMGFSDTEKSKKLIEIFDKKIIEIFKSGELERLYKKWNIKFTPEAWKE